MNCLLHKCNYKSISIFNFQFKKYYLEFIGYILFEVFQNSTSWFIAKCNDKIISQNSVYQKRQKYSIPISVN